MLPKSFQVGYYVCVVRGACVPLILRPTGKHAPEYTLKEHPLMRYVAGGCLHGITDGEVFKPAEEMGKKEEVFWTVWLVKPRSAVDDPFSVSG